MQYVHFFSNKNKFSFDNNQSAVNDIKNFKNYNFKLFFLYNSKIVFFNNRCFFLTFSKLFNLKEKLTNPVLLGKSKKTVFLGFIIGKKLLQSISSLEKNTLLEIRDSINILEKNIAPLVTALYSLNHWHKNNKYCSKCGKKNFITNMGYIIECISKNCKKKIFPRIDPAVIMLIYCKNKILLARNKNWKNNLYSCLAGFCEPSESLEETVKRETYEEIGIKVKNVKYMFSQFWPFPNNLMIAYTAEANNFKININKNEIDKAIWITKDELIKMSKRKTIILPNKYAIAHSLIESWKKLSFSKV